MCKQLEALHTQAVGGIAGGIEGGMSHTAGEDMTEEDIVVGVRTAGEGIEVDMLVAAGIEENL